MRSPLDAYGRSHRQAMPNQQPSAHDLAVAIINTYGTTALHQAAQKGTLNNCSGITADFLATVRDNHGWTPLHMAACFNHLDQVPHVTAPGLAVVKDNTGNTPLHCAAHFGHLAQIPGGTIALMDALTRR